MEKMRLSVLGADYTIFFKKRSDDKAFEECDGYTDWSNHTICIVEPERGENDLDNLDAYKKKVLRHEIVHAFFIESGLMDSTNQSIGGGGAYDEQLVDWIAIQGPKIVTAWKEAGCLG